MQLMKVPGILIENTVISSDFLLRDVIVDFYLPTNVADPSTLSLLLVNDGQSMKELGLKGILEDLYKTGSISPVLCVAIHAGEERKMEYGTVKQPDYLGRGAKASLYSSFVLEELLPFIYTTYHIEPTVQKAFAGFSLGGLMALDIVWNFAPEFTKVGVFSGSLWWRSLDQEHADYEDESHRIMHQQISTGSYHPGLKFFFTTGSLDETKDRNNNGVIDSIDDTQSLISDLVKLGYKYSSDILYINYEDGKHDIPTWARAMPEFFKWGWGT